MSFMEPMSADKSRPRLLVADDHVIFADTLRVFLEKSYSVQGVVSDGRAMVEEAIRLRPDLIVVDIGMPVLNGLDAVRQLMGQAPNMRFVFLTMHDDSDLAAAALELGPFGFVLKHSGGQELLKAIEHVLHGQPYVTPRLRAQNWVETKARARQVPTELTPRQREIVQLYGEGRSLKQIAGLLNLSVKTVEFHKHHIMESFNLDSNAALVVFAVNRGLIYLSPD
jgi:DNA-binding NarL/FixJ family response regulator